MRRAVDRSSGMPASRGTMERTSALTVAETAPVCSTRGGQRRSPSSYPRIADSKPCWHRPSVPQRCSPRRSRRTVDERRRRHRETATRVPPPAMLCIADSARPQPPNLRPISRASAAPGKGDNHAAARTRPCRSRSGGAGCRRSARAWGSPPVVDSMAGRGRRRRPDAAAVSISD